MWYQPAYMSDRRSEGMYGITRVQMQKRISRRVEFNMGKWATKT